MDIIGEKTVSLQTVMKDWMMVTCLINHGIMVLLDR